LKIYDLILQNVKSLELFSFNQNTSSASPTHNIYLYWSCSYSCEAKTID